VVVPFELRFPLARRRLRSRSSFSESSGVFGQPAGLQFRLDVFVERFFLCTLVLDLRFGLVGDLEVADIGLIRAARRSPTPSASARSSWSASLMSLMTRNRHRAAPALFAADAADVLEGFGRRPRLARRSIDRLPSLDAFWRVWW